MRILARTLVAAAFLAAASAAAAQTADEVVANHLKARGADKWREVQTMKVTAVVTAQGRATPMTTISKRPNLFRQEVTVNGATFVQAFDGTAAWGINPQLSLVPQELRGPQAKALADQADFDTVLMDYKAKGHTVELLGKEKVAGRDAYHLNVTRKNGVVQHYFIDAETWLEARITTRLGQPGQEVEFVSEPSKFQEVDGVMMPFRITQRLGEMPPVEITIQKIQFNVPTDDSLFRMPRKPSPSESPR